MCSPVQLPARRAAQLPQALLHIGGRLAGLPLKHANGGLRLRQERRLAPHPLQDALHLQDGQGR